MIQKHKLKKNLIIHIGTSTLELEKVLMYEFRYKYIKKKYNTEAELLFTDQ